jgi:hypothetical protein
LIEETAALNVSTNLASDSILWAVAAGSIQISYKGKTILVFVESYKER